LQCVVCVGYPEVEKSAPPTNPEAAGNAVSERYYNSLLIVEPSGTTLLNYRKRFLYYTDTTWAAEGNSGFGNLSLPIGIRPFTQPIFSRSHPIDPEYYGPRVPAPEIPPDFLPLDELFSKGSAPNFTGFVGPPDDSAASLSLPANLPSNRPVPTVEDGPRQVPTAVGICMDINPYRFEAPFTDFEFANHALKSGAKLVIVSMAWLTRLSRHELDEDEEWPDEATLDYWIQRFSPLLKAGLKRDYDGGEIASQNILVVLANRVGEEPGREGAEPARYAGSSCVLGIHPGRTDDPKPRVKTEVAVWARMGRAEEGLCIADTMTKFSYSYLITGRLNDEGAEETAGEGEAVQSTD
jgi:protein N-terminal amidase